MPVLPSKSSSCRKASTKDFNKQILTSLPIALMPWSVRLTCSPARQTLVWSVSSWQVSSNCFSLHRLRVAVARCPHSGAIRPKCSNWSAPWTQDLSSIGRVYRRGLSKFTPKDRTVAPVYAASWRVNTRSRCCEASCQRNSQPLMFASRPCSTSRPMRFDCMPGCPPQSPSGYRASSPT